MYMFYVIFVTECLQVAPHQQGVMVRPQVTLAQSSVVTFRGQPHSHIIVAQPKVVKQLQSGVTRASSSV